MELRAPLNMDGNKITDVGQATNDNEAPTWGQVRALFEGNNWKDSVRAASVANVTLSGPGATIDGVTLATNDRVLLKNQTTQSQNGIYVFNGAAVAMTRALDANTWDELEAATVRVEEGSSNIGSKWAQTQVNGTLDSSNIVWASDTGAAPDASESTKGIVELANQTEVDAGSDTTRAVTPAGLANSPWAKQLHEEDIGDASTLVFNIDHNFGTKAVAVHVFQNSDGLEIYPDIARTTTNRVVLTFGAASTPGSNQYHVVVIG